MSTQEKLVMELVDEICDYDEYCGDENCSKCGGVIRHWKKKLTHLIESAKREGAIEEMKMLQQKAEFMEQAGMNFKPAAHAHNRLIMLEQSEEQPHE